ncbi:hypothetical protein [Alteribacter keqinensis]|uniref:Uncharacterized protein n=1 Tax=Alteribacter keqinensis TaxID=2483800 RepID=A0A3M7TPG3_9BACI|nr:hypothetical protein [Alteribacter keqinensis]RNA67036.1 hypothetical protein EBO34_17760 [Alteribacter keqinensis]
MQTITYSQPPLDSDNQDVTVLLDGDHTGSMKRFFPTKVHDVMNQIVPNQWAHLTFTTLSGMEFTIVQSNGFIPNKPRHWNVLDGTQIVGKIKEETTHQAQVHTLTYTSHDRLITMKKGHIAGSSKKGVLEVKDGGGSADLTFKAESDFIRNGITTAHTVTVQQQADDPLLIAAMNYLLRLTDKN